MERTLPRSLGVSWRVVGVGLVTAVAALIRFATVDARPLWLDEIGQADAAILPLPEMLARIRSHAAAAPLDYFGTRLMLTVFGDLSAIRLWPALLGTVTLPLLYLAGRRWFTERTGLIGAALLAVAPFHVYYSTEARFYAGSALCAVLALLAFRTRWFAVVVAVTLYTHYFAILVPLALILVHRDGWRPFALGVVAWLPWALYALPSQVGYQHPAELMVGLSTVPTPELVARLIVPWSLAAVPVYAVAAVLLWKGRGWMLWTALASIILTGAATYIGDYFWSPRQVIFVLPLLALTAASGVRGSSR